MTDLSDQRLSGYSNTLLKCCQLTKTNFCLSTFLFTRFSVLPVDVLKKLFRKGTEFLACSFMESVGVDLLRSSTTRVTESLISAS